jgi:hypothetical protein
MHDESVLQEQFRRETYIRGATSFVGATATLPQRQVADLRVGGIAIGEQPQTAPQTSFTTITAIFPGRRSVCASLSY